MGEFCDKRTRRIARVAAEIVSGKIRDKEISNTDEDIEAALPAAIEDATRVVDLTDRCMREMAPEVEH